MAGWLKTINNERVGWFVLDHLSDRYLLPDLYNKGKDQLSTVNGCAMGSIAEIISEDESKYYLQLNGNNEWIQKKKSGGGGIDPSDYEWADESDIDALFQ